MPYAAYHAIKPDSITYTGTSATITADASVNFSAVSFLAFNNIFNSTYSNYIILIRNTSSNSGTVGIYMRLRSGSTDDPPNLAGENSYNYESLQVYGTTIFNSWYADYGFLIGYATNATYEGRYISLHQPFLQRQTSYRSIATEGYQTNFLTSHNGIHNKPLSYNGFSITPASGSITGLISIYGMVE